VSNPQVLKSTPVLFVETIETSLPFWQERLGFSRAAEVLHGGRLGFVNLGNGAVEVIYQSIALLQEDSAAHAGIFHDDKTFLFIEVENIDAVVAALAGFEIVMPRRETSYGSIEVGYREPGGHCVTFAQFKR